MGLDILGVKGFSYFNMVIEDKNNNNRIEMLFFIKREFYIFF